MTVPYVDLKAQHAALKQEIMAAIEKILDQGDFILGGEVQKLEENFAKYCGTRYAVGVNSGTDGLMLAMKVLGIGPGDEVITAPNSFLASASSIASVGATPVFVDTRDDLNIDPQKIQDAITPNTRAIMPVHLTGKPADMDAIMSIARRKNLYIIEDAAQAIGTMYDKRKAGSFGVINAFSLHPLKTLNAIGDGGMMTMNDQDLYKKCTQIRNIGLKNRTESDTWGMNSRLDTLQAAVVNIKLKYVDEWIKTRRKNADYYRKHLSGIVKCPTEGPNEYCAYHLFVIQTERRDDLQIYLSENGVDTKIHYPIPIHLQRCAQDLGYEPGAFPMVEKQARQILSIPIYQTLTKAQMDYVIEKITKFFKK